MMITLILILVVTISIHTYKISTGRLKTKIHLKNKVN